MQAAELKQKIIDNLLRQGFIINGDELRHPAIIDNDKEKLREMQSQSRQSIIDSYKPTLYYKEPEILAQFAHGKEVVPEKIQPRLVYAQNGTLEYDIVYYIALSTSVPGDKPRGRLRGYIVYDDQNGKIIGVVTVGSALLRQGDRDHWIGWDNDTRRRHMRHIMECWGLISIPPYTHLMGGKLVSLIGVSNAVRDDYRRVYTDDVALATTSSAFGRSSVYNRLRYRDEKTFLPVGWTKGFGRFHFDSGTLLDEICQFAARHHPNCPTHDRLFTIGTCLKLLGLPVQWMYHGIRRQMFAMPMAHNTLDFLNDRADKLDYVDRPMSDVVDWWKERWLLKRVAWDKRWQDVDGRSIRLWPESNGGLRGSQLNLMDVPPQPPPPPQRRAPRYVSRHLHKNDAPVQSTLEFPEIA